MNPTHVNHQKNYGLLVSIISIVLAVLLVVLYVIIDARTSDDPVFATTQRAEVTVSSALIKLGHDLIPNLLASLIAFLAIYWLLTRQGISPSETETSSVEANVLAAVQGAIGAGTTTPSGVIAFFPSFKEIDWGVWIKEANREIDIVVNYFDSWVNDHFDELVSFFQKGKTRLNLYIPDPSTPGLVEQLHLIYTDRSEEFLREKIALTAKRLRDALEQAGGKADRLKVYPLRRRPNYALQRIDGRIAVFSAFDNVRGHGVDSPAIVLDLHKEPNVHEYFERELNGLRAFVNVGANL